MTGVWVWRALMVALCFYVASSTAVTGAGLLVLPAAAAWLRAETVRAGWCR